MARRLVFLDRDGTLVADPGYLCDPAAVRLLPGVVDALARLRAAGYGLVIVTNQSGIGRGYYDVAAMRATNARLLELLAAAGIAVAAVYFCPHRPEDDCPCRKPRPGMLWRAARELGCDLAACWMVGDKQSDVDAGLAAGTRAVLLGPGPGAAPDLLAAAELILGADGQAGAEGRD